MALTADPFRRALVNAPAANVGTSALELAQALGFQDIERLFTGKTSHTSPSAAFQSVVAWLERIGLEEYRSQFLAAGYDELGFILQTGLSEADLDAIGVVKLGHRKKLGKLYHIQAQEEKGRSDSDSAESSSEDDSESESESESD